MSLDPHTFKGARGVVKYAYHTAVAVGPFVISYDKERGTATLVGRVEDQHPFYLQHPGLVFSTPVGRGVWHWPITACHITGDQFYADLGPLEEG